MGLEFENEKPYIDTRESVSKKIERYNDITRPLTREHNLLLAKKYMVESIYRSANVEGIGVTFPETQTICDGMSVAGKSVDDINAIVDLKNAWKWVFDNIENEINLSSLKTINRLAGKYTVINAGQIRTKYDEPIRVKLKGDEYYYPILPHSRNIEDMIEHILYDYDGIDVSLELFCQIAKAQIFNDGNKRTATLFANMHMIQNGHGILSIPETDIFEFYDLLTDYYSNDALKYKLKEFLLTKCITGNGHY